MSRPKVAVSDSKTEQTPSESQFTPSVQPASIHYRSETKDVEIIWEDGHTSVYETRYLRGWCPCALCQGHFVTRYEFVKNSGPALENAIPVGAYGVNFIWSDAHKAGIFTFRELRSICPCSTCEGSSRVASPQRAALAEIAK